jgi:hypothetical protein
MKTTRSRRSVCAFESLEGRALMAAYMKLGDIKGEATAAQTAEIHIALPLVEPATLLLPAVQKVREAGARGGVGVAAGDITG